MFTCEDCGSLRFGDSCPCTAYTVIDEDGDDHTVFATSAHDAALSFAEISNVNGDYYLMDDCVEIEVDGVKFAISAEPDIHYRATEVKP